MAWLNIGLLIASLAAREKEHDDVPVLVLWKATSPVDNNGIGQCVSVDAGRVSMTTSC